MANIYLFTDYRAFLSELLANRRGELNRLAHSAQMSPSTLSQVFKGARDLTPEQSAGVCSYFGLPKSQTYYFLLLVQHSRAGTKELREIIQEQLNTIRMAENQLVKRVSVKKHLALGEQAIFYSNWYYSGVRNLLATSQVKTVQDIAERLGISRATAQEVIQFLVRHGLLQETADGKWKNGPGSTHLEGTSPLVGRHHSNWRVKAMEKHPKLDHERELAYTSPLSISKGDVLKVREELMKTIVRVCEVVDRSVSEKTFCLNVDWFEF